MESGSRSKHIGLSDMSKNSDDVAKYYDNWASDYNETLADWRYEAPKQVASMFSAKLSPKSAILDAGCGTGLSGKAFLAAGFTTIDGIDVSHRSLEIAGMTSAYRALHKMDLQLLPLLIPDGYYDGLACVGVLTYLADSVGTLREFNRVVRSGGVVVVTQRSDLFVEREFQEVLEGLLNDGDISQVSISEPRPYLPDNEEFGDHILVHYVSYTVV
ncbi:MAG: methyltransferase domain-containing protein [Gammaproteobacteria bacterium]|nr:methyltransferase domain-containing protein [Gammaproteobacteria bacterium]